MGQSRHEHANLVPAPARIARDGGHVYRYKQQTLEQAIVQKLARVVSTLRAAHLCLEAGFLQEAAILQRTVDEAQEDVLFLVYGRIAGHWCDLQDKYLENFWRDSALSKASVSRAKIRDTLAAIEGSLTNTPVDAALRPTKDIYGIYSGYAHCASPHVMEMIVDSDPPTYCLTGLRGSTFQQDQVYDIRNQHYRAHVAFAVTCLLFNDPEKFRHLMDFADQFMFATDY